MPAKIVETWKSRARQLKVEVYALYLAYRDPRVPWYARVFSACVVAYALSPIDLIPDFIPILGYLDDLLIVPLGIVIALKMIPPQVMAESRIKSQDMVDKNPTSLWGALVIIAIWVLGIALTVWVVFRYLLPGIS